MQIRSQLLMVCQAITLGVLLLAPSGARAQAENPLLFESNSLLELTMTVNFDTLCRPSVTPGCEYSPSEFKYQDADGNERTVPIRIRRRDGWRALQTNCQMPTLFVRFSENDVVGTPFEGQSSLALTSHCGKGISPELVPSRRRPDRFESYVVSEYLGYRLNNLITDMSLKVRLVRISYVNPDDPKDDFTHHAFFAEHFESLASRFDAELLPAGSFDLDLLDADAADRVALFQYMVGNTDWSVENQDNIILLRMPDGQHIPVMFDLDQSGLVNPYYAKPARHLPISSVKQRYYLGYCQRDTDWDALFASFTNQYENVMNMVAETPGLGRGDRRVAGAYLDSFFDILNSQSARRNGIINACQPLPDSS